MPTRRRRATPTVLASLLAALVGALLTLPVCAQPPTIPLPPDLKVEPPAADVPDDLARFSGVWAHGAWDGVLPHVLVVESVDRAGGARVVSALGDFAEGRISRGYRRLVARIDGDALVVDVSEGARATYRVAGEALHGIYTSGRRTSGVVLRRAPLADVAAVPATAPGVVPGTTVRIPMGEAGPDGRPITLEATLYLPPGESRHPVLLFNHGSTGGGTVQATDTLRPSRQAPFFVARGFAVLAPMRRGRGASDGAHEEREGACDPSALNPGLARAIEDVDAAMAYLRAQPWADPDRVLIGGQSRGGILSVVYAAQRAGAVRGVINFAGGWTSDGCDLRGPSFNEATFASAGGRTRVPMLWLYAVGDRYYMEQSVRRYHRAFADAGGVATFHVFPAIGGDGHRLVDRAEIWTPAAEQYVRGLRL